MVRKGYIALHRKLLDNPIICKDSDYLAVWIYLLLTATHFEYEEVFDGKKIILKKGQLITGRKSISEKLKISESKVTRIINSFENEQQIEQQACNRNRLITVLKWSSYQKSEQQNEQPVNNQRTTSEQPVNTYNNDNNERMKEYKNKNKYIVEKAIAYLNAQTGHKYEPTEANANRISARINEGYTLKDIMQVIHNKTAEWESDYDNMRKYLRPETLFGTKFDTYLNGEGKCFRTSAEINEIQTFGTNHLELKTGPWDCETKGQDNSE